MVKASHLAQSSPYETTFTGDPMQELDKNVTKHIDKANDELKEVFDSLSRAEELRATAKTLRKSNIAAAENALATLNRSLATLKK